VKENNYFLPREYVHRRDMKPWDDSEFHNDLYQKEVYALAARTMAENPSWKTVIDIGCGSGYKLIKQLGCYDTIGVELPIALPALYRRYPDRDWREYNEHLFATCSPDLLISADVIEHVEEPDHFLLGLQLFRTVKKFIFSTPDRHLVRGPKDMGPPGNPAHYREWTLPEFKRYLSCFFTVDSIEVVRQAHGTIAAVCSQLPGHTY